MRYLLFLAMLVASSFATVNLPPQEDVACHNLQNLNNPLAYRLKSVVCEALAGHLSPETESDVIRLLFTNIDSVLTDFGLLSHESSTHMFVLFLQWATRQFLNVVPFAGVILLVILWTTLYVKQQNISLTHSFAFFMIDQEGKYTWAAGG